MFVFPLYFQLAGDAGVSPGVAGVSHYHVLRGAARSHRPLHGSNPAPRELGSGGILALSGAGLAANDLLGSRVRQYSLEDN